MTHLIRYLSKLRKTVSCSVNLGKRGQQWKKICQPIWDASVLVFASFKTIAVNKQMLTIPKSFADVWIRTAYLWRMKRPLCSLHHCHFILPHQQWSCFKRRSLQRSVKERVSERERERERERKGSHCTFCMILILRRKNNFFAFERSNLFFIFSNDKQCASVKAWSSLVKEESLACQITSPFNNKLGCFCK